VDIIRYSDRGALLVLRSGSKVGFGDISVLPGWSRENLEEALSPLNNTPAFLWALSSAQMHLENIQPKNPQLPKLGQDKIKVGHMTPKEAAKVARGKRVDVNRKWTLMQAIEFCALVDDVEFIEEPTDSLEAFVELKKRTKHRLAIDESLREHGLEETLKADPDLLVIKPPMTGSVETILELAKHFTIALSSSFESPLGHFNLALLRAKIDTA